MSPKLILLTDVGDFVGINGIYMYCATSDNYMLFCVMFYYRNLRRVHCGCSRPATDERQSKL